jgi:preflagellin peptidase FlaK
VLSIARTSVALVFLVYASWSDYKTREVSNKVWIAFAPIAFALTFAELFIYEPENLIFYGLSFAITATIAVLLFYSGGFGGADSKALMCLALALPFYPVSLTVSTMPEVSPISKIFFPFSVFSNGVLLAAAAALYMLARNLVWQRRTGERLFEAHYAGASFATRILVLMTGYKMPLDKIKEKWHVYPIEDVEENADGSVVRKLAVLPKDETRTAVIERLETAIRTNKIHSKIWATPGLPMLIFITAGLIIGLVFGDVIWLLIRFLLR